MQQTTMQRQIDGMKFLFSLLVLLVLSGSGLNLKPVELVCFVLFQQKSALSVDRSASNQRCYFNALQISRYSAIYGS